MFLNIRNIFNIEGKFEMFEIERESAYDACNAKTKLCHANTNKKTKIYR